MELREAIEHARAVAEGCPAGTHDCAYQHDKLADWLEELEKLHKALGENYNLDRLKELVEADNDGRCVVLPCKTVLRDGQLLYQKRKREKENAKK